MRHPQFFEEVSKMDPKEDILIRVWCYMKYQTYSPANDSYCKELRIATWFWTRARGLTWKGVFRTLLKVISIGWRVQDGPQYAVNCYIQTALQ